MGRQTLGRIGSMLVAIIVVGGGLMGLSTMTLLLTEIPIITPIIEAELTPAATTTQQSLDRLYHNHRETICERSFNMTDCSLSVMIEQFDQRPLDTYDSIERQIRDAQLLGLLIKLNTTRTFHPNTAESIVSAHLTRASVLSEHAILMAHSTTMADEIAETCELQEDAPHQCLDTFSTILDEQLQNNTAKQWSCSIHHLDTYHNDLISQDIPKNDLIAYYSSTERLIDIRSSMNTDGCRPTLAQFPRPFNDYLQTTFVMLAAAIRTQQATTNIQNKADQISTRYEAQINATD